MVWAALSAGTMLQLRSRPAERAVIVTVSLGTHMLLHAGVRGGRPPIPRPSPPSSSRVVECTASWSVTLTACCVVIKSHGAAALAAPPSLPSPPSLISLPLAASAPRKAGAAVHTPTQLRSSSLDAGSRRTLPSHHDVQVPPGPMLWPGGQPSTLGPFGNDQLKLPTQLPRRHAKW